MFSVKDQFTPHEMAPLRLLPQQVSTFLEMALTIFSTW